MRVRPDPAVAHVAEWVYRQGESLRPDFAQAERFLNALDPQTTEFSFRVFSDSPYTRLPGHDPLERAIHGGLRECWQQLIDLNRRGAAISVTINRTDGSGRAIENVDWVRALFLDDDGPSQPLNRFPLTPQLQVETSPGHYHHYWLVDGVDLESFHAWQKALANRFGGDDKVLALNQSMQLPGVWRRKKLSNPVLPVIRKINKIDKYSKREVEEELLGLKTTGFSTVS